MKLEEAIFAGRLGFVEIQLHSLIHQTSTCEALVLDRIESLEAQCVVSRKQISSKTIDLNVAGSAMDSIEEVLELKCLANGSLRFRLNVRGWLPGSRNAQRFLLISERVNIETIALSSPSKANHAASQSQVQGFHHRLQPLFFETEDDEDLGNAVACQYCLELSFIYFPNHISFPFLAISTLTESRFPVEVCEQMRQLLMLSDQSVSSSLQSEDVVVVGSQIDRELLLQAIDRLILLHSDQQSQSPRKARTIPNSMQFSQSNQVDAVTAFSQTKSFLESFARTLSQVNTDYIALLFLT